MELLPLLIFLGGIIYSAIASQKDKSKDEERNIDPSRMDRPTNPSAPRRRQPSTQESSKGFFDDIKSELERSFGGAGGTEEKRAQRPERNSSPQQSSRPDRNRTERRERTSNQRPMNERSFGRSLEEKARESDLGRRAIDMYEDKKPTDRAEHAARAREAKEKVYTQGYDKRESRDRVKRETGIGREVADEVRYSYGDDRTEMHRRGKEEKSVITRGDITFDKKAVVNGIIFNEILGKPKSKR